MTSGTQQEPTEKLYWADPFATSFDATVARLAEHGGKASVVLEKTLFYPEAGGQLGDTGTLVVGGRSLAIVDTQIDEAGVIHHVLPEAIVADTLDGPAHGTLDRERRRDQMAQHTAQHALSRALLDVARAPTVSARLGQTSSTIDLDVSAVADADLARAEDLVNAIAMEDVPVRALFPTADELRAMDLRRTPKVTTNVRVIEIDGFDRTPCGGTHCVRSGQVGSVRFVGVERYKGKIRLTFQAGRRALDDARAQHRVLAELARGFSCGVPDVPAAIAKLRGELEAARDAMGHARGELVGLLADEILARTPRDPGGTTVVCIRRERGDAGEIRALAARLARRDDVVAIVWAPDGDACRVSAQRGGAARFDCGAWLKAVAESRGARGGGRPERAEGRVPGTEISAPPTPAP